MALNIERIEEKIDKVVSAATPVNMDIGGVQLESMVQMMELAKAMAISGPAVPPWLRGNMGACLAIWIKATRFGFDPFSLAEHSFITIKRSKNDQGQWEAVETVAFDSSVIRSIINAHAPIEGRIRYSFEGDGDERVCIASAQPKEGGPPIIHRSLPLGERKKSIERNDAGKLKGSPLWDHKPDVQQAYDTGRDLCRIHFPEILMGWHDKDDFEAAAGETAKDITPKRSALKDRLKGGNKGRGFSAAHVEEQTNSASVSADGKAGEGPGEKSQPEMTGPTPAGPASGSLEEILHIEVADALEMGREARRLAPEAEASTIEIPAALHGEGLQAQRDAFLAGWHDL